MEILRVPSSPDFTIEAPAANTAYSLYYQDLADNSINMESVLSDSNSNIIFAIPRTVDTEYRVWLDLDDETVWEDYVSVVRPYSDPYLHGATASEIDSYAKNERLARAIIDSVIADGFYYKSRAIELVGNGSDYIPLWDDVRVINQVYINNLLAFDRSLDTNPLVYKLSPDKTAMIAYYDSELNRAESTVVSIRGASGDLGGEGFYGTTFPAGQDYTIVAEVGYRSLPSDIVEAAELLIEDISCGKLDYYKRYVSAYNTDQFRIQFDKAVFQGTGNILVDKILSKYLKSITKIGVL